jgi:glycosyltransferase involved in cell wall biosynthesis
VGHLAEWALADTGALTCEPGDPAGLADVIEQLAADDALRQQLARTVQAHASHHDAKRAAGRVRELYEELSNERG